ncbi:biotin transport system substrate-specific component [Meinhardsimonia xiamenensis]|jgi:biotin transport system substrate-specific component|uniref:Biotin transporter n=1 Tax=Meinhardsimonia xiamenensis TaxID=990712 RepID=A0A1G9AKP9_9RHOB|nr:biotin transporter BioY [Meinhardsimonia xiamenensis]PRX35339.1 biotin transport system substrate-specific component [Meinhardsimonia xiamenensis]SDK27912.1 biotin transport system substrate-specific component [Meinhardsimonia xiamenensis]
MVQNTGTVTLAANRTLAQKALMVIAGSAFIALAAQITVPFYPVPMTLQTLAVLLVGFTYGSRLGAATLLAYLAEGATGLPVFAGGANGAAFFGPTAGFLVGFVPMAWLAGLASERGLARRPLALALAGIAISAALYIPGLAWPMAIAKAFGIEAGWIGRSFTDFYWVHFVKPFLIGDTVKAVLAALIASGALTALARRRAG